MPQSVLQFRDSVVINSLMSQYRSLGWTEKWHQNQLVNKSRIEHRTEADSRMRLGVKENGLARHFRKQIL
jgi:hypothetical protein